MKVDDKSVINTNFMSLTSIQGRALRAYVTKHACYIRIGFHSGNRRAYNHL
jgi:hypothetical protein